MSTERRWSGAGRRLGANATIVCGITIGRYAFIGAGAAVTDDVPTMHWLSVCQDEFKDGCVIVGSHSHLAKRPSFS